MLDTGCRIGEILSLNRREIDFDTLLLSVYGKTGYRKVPISFELRKQIWKYIKQDSNGFFFKPELARLLLIETFLEE
jgi:integrase